MRRKKEASKVKQTNKAKQHSTPKAITFPRKNELPRVGLEPTTLYTLDRALYQLSYRGSSAGWAQIQVRDFKFGWLTYSSVQDGGLTYSSVQCRCIIVILHYTAARKTNPRCEKAPPPDTPTLPQVLHEIALKSRTSTLNEISPPLAHLHTHASCSTAVPQCSVHECIHEPTASIDHQAPTLHFSQECTNPDMFTTVRDDSADSDWEENPVPSLRERLVARGKAAQASSRPRTSQTDFLRMMRSVRSNKARCAEANKLEDYGCSSHLKQVSTKLNVTECSPAHLSPPSPTKRTVKPPRYRKSPKKMALARTAEEPIMLSDSSDDELSFFDRLRNTDCKSKCSSDCSSADGSVRRDDTHFTENPATKGTKHDPIVL